jgi:hypothetical protein
MIARISQYLYDTNSTGETPWLRFLSLDPSSRACGDSLSVFTKDFACEFFIFSLFAIRLDDGIEGDGSLAGGHDENGALGTGRHNGQGDAKRGMSE